VEQECHSIRKEGSKDEAYFEKRNSQKGELQLSAAQAESAFISGNFNDWNPASIP
jgi:hypothetical protein